MRISDWSSDVCSSDLRDSRQSGDAEPDDDGPHQMAGDHDYPARADRRARGRPLRSRDLSMVKLNKIYTRTGDGGTTGLVDGSRIAKSAPLIDRKSVVLGKSVSVRVDLGGRRRIKKKNHNQSQTQHHN